MKLSTEVKTPLMMLLVLSVPFAHELFPVSSGKVAGAETGYPAMPLIRQLRLKHVTL